MMDKPAVQAPTQRRKLTELNVEVALHPWFTVLQHEIGKAVLAAAQAGMPEYLAINVYRDSLASAVQDAVQVRGKETIR